MKKILIPIVALAAILFAGQVSAEGNLVTYMQQVFSRIVPLVIELHEEGLSEEEIVEKLMDKDYGRENILPEDLRQDIKKTVEKSNAAVTKTNKINYGRYKKTLRSGDKGEEVKALQERLNVLAKELGLGDALFVDGSYGPATRRLVKAIQAYKGLSADGVVGPKTYEKMDGMNTNYTKVEAKKVEAVKYDKEVKNTSADKE